MPPPLPPPPMPNPPMASSVNQRTPNGGSFSPSEVVTTGTGLTAAPTTASNGFTVSVSAAGLHQTLLQGSAVLPFRGERLRPCRLPRPRNSSVPPRRPFKTAGSPPRRVPVRFWLGGRAALRYTDNTTPS